MIPPESGWRGGARDLQRSQPEGRGAPGHGMAISLAGVDPCRTDTGPAGGTGTRGCQPHSHHGDRDPGRRGGSPAGERGCRLRAESGEPGDRAEPAGAKQAHSSGLGRDHPAARGRALGPATRRHDHRLAWRSRGVPHLGRPVGGRGDSAPTGASAPVRPARGLGEVVQGGAERQGPTGGGARDRGHPEHHQRGPGQGERAAGESAGAPVRSGVGNPALRPGAVADRAGEERSGQPPGDAGCPADLEPYLVGSGSSARPPPGSKPPAAAGATSCSEWQETSGGGSASRLSSSWRSWSSWCVPVAGPGPGSSRRPASPLRPGCRSVRPLPRWS